MKPQRATNSGVNLRLNVLFVKGQTITGIIVVLVSVHVIAIFYSWNMQVIFAKCYFNFKLLLS